MIAITVNGQPCSIADGSTILDLLSLRGIDPTRVVVEVDGTIVKKEDFGNGSLRDNAAVEILRFVGGG
jgi:thiamine biosynthesis protein ThiS